MNYEPPQLQRRSPRTGAEPGRFIALDLTPSRAAEAALAELGRRSRVMLTMERDRLDRDLVEAITLQDYLYLGRLQVVCYGNLMEASLPDLVGYAASSLEESA